MCRNIKRLRHADHAPTDRELQHTAPQFIRKISGFRAPSRANQDAFDAAVEEVAAAGRKLFGSLGLPRRIPGVEDSHSPATAL